MCKIRVSGLRRRGDDPESLFIVETTTLDKIIGPEERVDLIKVDVEGAEYQVFRGAMETIRRCRPIILFEHGLGGADFYGTKPDDVYELLVGSCGLRISLLEVWLRGGNSLNKEELLEQYYGRINFFFIASP